MKIFQFLFSVSLLGCYIMCTDMHVITFNNQLFLFSLLVFAIWIGLGLSEFCVMMKNLRYLEVNNEGSQGFQQT